MLPDSPPRVETTKYNSEYFETTFQLAYDMNSVPVKRIYNAIKEIKQMRTEMDYAIFNYVCDSTGKSIEFKSNVDFLNYMSERGYQMASSIERSTGIDYTFKRR